MEHNGTMIQAFHWYTPADGSLWKQLAGEADALAKAGISALWLPPAYKGAGGDKDVGYGVYDHYDLGEFKQKGSVRTKYGTRKDYLRAIQAAHQAGMQVYADMVFNHKLGGDQQEEFKATPYNPHNRNEAIGELQTIKAWTHFTFPGRQGTYSPMQWHWWHFNAVDVNDIPGSEKAIYLHEGKHFDKDVDTEKGNFDFLMGCDIDLDHPEVAEELFRWGEWYLDTTGVDGFRFDAVKHVSATFFVNWLDHLRQYSGKPLFAVGEYWSPEHAILTDFVERTNCNMMLFDTRLHYNFAAAGREKAAFDLRQVFDNTLVASRPELAVTLVSNHDTQPLQALESVVEPWFKPLAYALILLRQGGYPCIFAADYYGAEYREKDREGHWQDVTMASHRWMIERFLQVRKTQAFGEQVDYFDDPHCIGWTRAGNQEHPGGMAVLLSNDKEASKHMHTGAAQAVYVDHTEHVKEPVTTNAEGWGEFPCQGASISVWIPK